MTVYELITELSKIDGSLHVVLKDDIGAFVILEKPIIAKLTKSDEINSIHGDFYEKDDDEFDDGVFEDYLIFPISPRYKSKSTKG